MAGQVVVVSGGSRGIGRAVVNRFRGDGARLVTCGRGERPAALRDWDLVVGVNCRGVFNTCRATLAVTEAARRDALTRYPAERLGTAEDVAAAVALLASADAAFVTGQFLSVDGGLTSGSPLRPNLF